MRPAAGSGLGSKGLAILLQPALQAASGHVEIC